MKRLLLLLLLLAILVAGGIALHARRVAARDRELAELLAGPFLPGATVVGNSWYFGISSGPGDEFECSVSGETILDPGAETPADLVVTRASSADPDGTFSVVQWTIRAPRSRRMGRRGLRRPPSVSLAGDFALRIQGG